VGVMDSNLQGEAERVLRALPTPPVLGCYLTAPGFFRPKVK
jgi:hypothetical protein